MALAEHDPSAVFPENQGVTDMSHKQLHEFAATKTGGLPTKVKSRDMHETKRGFGAAKRSDHGRHSRKRGDSMT